MNTHCVPNSTVPSSFATQLPFDFQEKTPVIFFLCIRDISIKDSSLHEKAESVLKLSLEKSCIGTGRVIN
jgi:hypothetical protein